MTDSQEPKIEDLGVGVSLRILIDLVEIEDVAIDLDHLLRSLENLSEKCIIVLDVIEAIAQEMMIVPEDHKNLKTGRKERNRESQKGGKKGDLHLQGREVQVAAQDQVAQVRLTD